MMAPGGLLVLVVASALQLRAQRDSECNCACCTAQIPRDDEPSRCGLPLTRSDIPGAYFASCSAKCFFEGDFILASPQGDEFDTERFCFNHCEPAVAKATTPGGACQSVTQETVLRTYVNTTHSVDLGTGPIGGLPMSNEMGNGHALVLDGDPLAKGDGFACARFEPGQVCSDPGGVSCTVLRDAESSATCNDICSTKGLHCSKASAGDCTKAADAALLQASNATVNSSSANFSNVPDALGQSSVGHDFDGPSQSCSATMIAAVTCTRPEGGGPSSCERAESETPVSLCECAIYL